MVQDCRAGRPFERGKALVLDETRDRHELVAARAIEVIVMHPDRLEPGAPVIEHDFARDAVGGKLLGGAKYR